MEGEHNFCSPSIVETIYTAATKNGRHFPMSLKDYMTSRMNQSIPKSFFQVCILFDDQELEVNGSNFSFHDNHID